MTVGNHTLPTEILRTCTDGFLWCFADWAYTVTNGLFWAVALMSFCVVLYMATAYLGSVRAFGFGSFVGMIGAIWLAIAGLLSWWIASLFILTGIIGLAMMIMSEK